MASAGSTATAFVFREEAPGEAQAIYRVHTAAFPGPAEARLVDALRDAGRLDLSLVAATPRAGIVGHIAFSPVSVNGQGGGAGLGPVAVAPAFRRRGAAAGLIAAGLAICARRGTGFVVVLGDPRYYARFGFVPAPARGLRDEYDGGDAFQVLELRPGAIPAAGGLVRYAPEFAAV